MRANKGSFMRYNVLLNIASYSIVLVMLMSCNPDNSRKTSNMFAEFERSEELKDYPSGSTISFYQDKLYLMGDDASSLLILGKDFKVQEKIPFFPGDAGRIQKAQKADIESSEWIMNDNEAKHWLFGSGSSSPQRDSAFRFDPETKSVERIDLSTFYNKLRHSEIRDLNIEGTAMVKNSLLFGSRGNLTNKQNYFIQTSLAALSGEGSPRVVALNLPDGMGISGMSYLADLDILLLTTSTENTASAYDDGEIGESCLGVIYHFSDKLSGSSIGTDDWIVLSELDAVFKGQKIESICTSGVQNDGRVSAVLVSDDDKGTTRLFSLKLDFRE